MAALIVVIVGGLGSFEGAVLGSLIVGLLSNYGQAYFPALAIILVALGFTLLGESMREALDPKNRR